MPNQRDPYMTEQFGHFSFWGHSRSFIPYVLAALTTVLAATMASESLLVPLAFLLLLSFVILLFKEPKYALFLILLTKPIIDTTWNARIPGIGINALQIVGAAFPFFAFLIIVLKRTPVNRYTSAFPILVFLALNALSMFYALLRAGEIEIWRFVEGVFGIGPLFLQFLNGIAAYFLIPFLVRTEKDRKIFLGVLVLAGLFPLTTGLLQIGGFIEGRTIRTTGDLIRISGLYYDSTNMRMYSLQTLVAIVGLLFYSKDSIRSRWNWKYAGMLIMIPLLLIVIYYGYSKAAVAIVLSWTVLLCLFKLKSVYLILFVTGLSVLFTTIDETPLALDRLFHKEISFAEGTLAEENEYTLLGGRFKRWEDYLSRFSDADLMDKLLCVQYSIGIMAHNDFVRVLIGTGVLGLLSYSWVLLSIIRRVVSEAITSKTGLSISALMILVSFLIDSLGLVPLIYPGYCWVTFGLISLSLNRNLFANDFQTDKKKNE